MVLRADRGRGRTVKLSGQIKQAGAVTAQKRDVPVGYEEVKDRDVQFERTETGLVAQLLTVNDKTIGPRFDTSDRLLGARGVARKALRFPSLLRSKRSPGKVRMIS